MGNEFPVRVGVSARLRRGDPAARGSQRKDLLGIESSLPGLLAGQGGVPLVLACPPEYGTDALSSLARRMIASVDALVLQGGADVAPESYGARPLRPEWQGDSQRDHFERELLQAAMAADKPVLGLCRGCQLLNVAFGGSLFQDLQQLRPGSLAHSQPQRYEQHVHAVRLADGGLLARCHARQDGLVTSAHHQGIDRLGQGLNIEAWCAEDGLVEAIRADSGWVVGLQWHPEFHAGRPELLAPEPLLAEFIAVAARVAEASA